MLQIIASKLICKYVKQGGRENQPLVPKSDLPSKPEADFNY